ncbi:hypothetical protein T492DRAFT_869932 [Pavlovales sp. CCMP2436]|nr:hypothetical protein T492DRAFT_869932 [Pavlovales sp. CCMP2436]
MELDRQANALWRLASRVPEGEARAEGCAADCTCSAACKLYTRRAEAKDRYKDHHMTLELDLQTIDEDYREGAALEQLAEAAEQLAAAEAAAEAAAHQAFLQADKLQADNSFAFLELDSAEQLADAEAANEAAADAAISQGDLLALLAAGKRKADTPFAAFLEDLGLDDDMQIALNANFERRAKQQEERDKAADLRTAHHDLARGWRADNDADIEEFIRAKDTLYAKIRRREPLTDDERAHARRHMRMEDISACKSASKYISKYASKSAAEPAAEPADEPKQLARLRALNCGICGYKGTKNQIQADAHLAGHLHDFYNK